MLWVVIGGSELRLSAKIRRFSSTLSWSERSSEREGNSEPGSLFLAGIRSKMVNTPVVIDEVNRSTHPLYLDA